MKRFDYVVVGGGSAGCTVASRLSENGEYSVALLEAGGTHNNPLISIPFNFAFTVPKGSHNWSFETVPQPGLNGRIGYQPRGKVLGGSSSINAMVYIRGAKEDYDNWQALGNRGWSYEDVLPFFRKAQNRQKGANEFHGIGGPLVALCGTGSPLPDPSRAGPCNVVIAGRHMFLIDAGEGSARNIALMGLPLARLEGVFLTHFHSDHIDGMGPVMLMRWTGASSQLPLPVRGPTGVERVIAGFNQAYAIDYGYRTGHHGPSIAPPSGAGAIAFPFALPPAGKGDALVIYEKDGLKVTAIRVDHGPVSPAVGYRFDYKGRSVVISGDTSQSPSLVAAAKGADLLVHEALQPKLLKYLTAALDAKGLKNTAQITRDIVNYHTTPEQAADTAREAGARNLVLSHIVPVVPSSFFYPAFLGDAHAHFKGPITVGEDGMLFMLPTGSSVIEKRKLF